MNQSSPEETSSCRQGSMVQLKYEKVDFMDRVKSCLQDEVVASTIYKVAEDTKNLLAMMEKMQSHLMKTEARLAELEAADKEFCPREVDVPRHEPTAAFQRTLSGWIRASLVSQRIYNMKWDLNKKFDTKENQLVTNNIIKFVGDQIESTGETPWTNVISQRELYRKICKSYRNQKDKYHLTPEKYAINKKNHVRKSRRCTKQVHRRKILDHPEYGKTMRDIYGNDVEKLLIEQLQSDDESTDSEMGKTTRDSYLRVMCPSWRTPRAIEAFKKFDEFDLLLRKHSVKDRKRRQPGRVKDSGIKELYLHKAPRWAYTDPHH